MYRILGRGTWLLAATFALVLAFAGNAAAASFEARGSTEQVDVTGLPATDDPSDAQVQLIDSSDNVVQTKNANFLGGALFRNVAPGDYTVSSGGETSPTVTVTQDPIKAHTSAAPANAGTLYDPTTNPVKSHGYGYMTMRDGTKLAYTTHPPQDVLNALTLPTPLVTAIQSLTAAGDPSATNKTPTLVEYSGYGYARPSGPVSGIEALANLMGFTVVDVNMRGTGCSGGAFDFFEPLQSLDGYDVDEIVAHQPWVKDGKVGMLGISYGGISQLFTGQTQPPDLAAISPLSVIDQTQTTLYPGGILNTGFAVAWAQERQDQAKPADPSKASDPRYGGQPYADDQITAEGGGSICKANQVLHPDAADLIGKIRANDHYIPDVADPLSPITFVNRITAPTFMACQWTDEQTGGHCPTLAEHMAPTTKRWFTYTNGVHTDSLDPETYNRLYDFLSIYVAGEAPAFNPFHTVFQQSWPVAMQAIFGINPSPPTEASLPHDPIQDPSNATLSQAQTAFEALPSVRVLFDNGAGASPTATSSHPGWPYPGFEHSFSSFPIPGTQARSWYLTPGGGLADQSPSAPAADGFTWDAHARPANDFSGDSGSGTNGLWTDTPNYQWSQDPAGSAAAYITPALSADTAVVGAGRVDLWVRSSTPDVDLQATISEVRPDGKETFVQGGWVKAKARALDPAKSTELEPVQSLLQEQFAGMPSDQFVPVTIPLYYEGHMYRAGSRIRVRISAPNGDQPIWSFAEAIPNGQANVAIGYGGSMPSKLELPVVPGVSAPTGLPPCPGLRGEPCRDYQPFANRPASLTSGVQSKRKCAKPKKRKKKSAATSKKHKRKGCHKKKHHKKK
jgi:uncharacterized protein